jgi:hypothetical protein
LIAANGTETVSSLPLGELQLVAEVAVLGRVTDLGSHAEKIGGHQLRSSKRLDRTVGEKGQMGRRPFRRKKATRPVGKYPEIPGVLVGNDEYLTQRM